jgi:hypothetical protein
MILMIKDPYLFQSNLIDLFQSNPESLYMYGEMDFKDIDKWQFSRDDIVLESLLTSGHFADIFLATVRTTGEYVVAKTLKSECESNI